MKNMKLLSLLVFLLSISTVRTFEAMKVDKSTHGGGAGPSGDEKADKEAVKELARLKAIEKARLQAAEKAEKEAAKAQEKAAKALAQAVKASDAVRDMEGDNSAASGAAEVLDRSSVAW